MSDKMKWTRLHELKAILIYKKVKLEFDKDKVFPENKFSSLNKKLANIRSLDTDDGLSSVSKQLREVWYEYKDTTIEALEKEVLKEQGKLEKCPGKQGFKYKKAS